VKIAPSLLAADFSKLGEEIKRLEEANVDLLHFDIMDGHFVPNLTFGPYQVSYLRDKTNLPFDIHLMVTHPDLFIDPFHKIGANMISFHYEAIRKENKIRLLIDNIKKRGILAGLAISPSTLPTTILKYTKDLDYIVIMSVEPGFGGQKFINSTLDKIKFLKNSLKTLNLVDKVLLEVDGGINNHIALSLKEEGADILVAGSFLFTSPDIKVAVNSLRF
jgi:ribulose-phosphate 3-epimerase